MIWPLRIFFLIVFVTMICTNLWAGSQVAIWAIPPNVIGHPWFINSIFDAYFGFFTFYCWLVYKETSWLARALWLIAIVLLGNIATAAYLLIQLFRLPADARIEQLLLRRS